MNTDCATWLAKITENWVRDLGKCARRANAKANGRAATIRRLLTENTTIRNGMLSIGPRRCSRRICDALTSEHLAPHGQLHVDAEYHIERIIREVFDV